MRQIDFRKELNKEQYDVVTAKAGPHLVLAGAGSGKTRTLVYRVAWLIDQGIKPEKILLLTFTNKAANEMMSRVKELLGLKEKDSLSVWGGTFHSIANRLLRFYGKAIGINSNFTILDQEDSKTLLKKISKEFFSGLDSKHLPSVNLLKEAISFAVNAKISLAESLEKKFPEWLPLLEHFDKIAQEYKKRKQQNNSFDFDDLLTYWLKLTKHPDISLKLSQKWQYVLVDEYQDTNSLQAEIIYNLVKDHQNILVVGDDAQSIYSFRAANIQNIFDFPVLFKHCQTHKLETNYRSSPEILNLANMVIDGNTEQFKKNLRAVLSSYLKPELVATRTNIDEARWIVRRIRALLNEGMKPSEIVVLFRAAHHSQVLEMELNKNSIPYQMRGGLKFFERAHVKDVIAFLRLIINHQDEISTLRILNLYSGIGPATAVKIWQQIKNLESLRDIDNLKLNLGTKASVGWLEIKSIIKLAYDHRQANPAETIRLVVDKYSDYLLEQYTDYRQRQDDLEQLTIFAANYKELGDFLAEVSLQENFTLNEGRSSETIVLSTIHQAKGLEWSAVFIINLTDKSLPHPLSVDEDNIAEERRLFYVAITRAKQYLYLTYPLSSFNYQGYKSLQPSEFITCLDSNLLTFNDLARSAVYAAADGIEYSADDTTSDFWDEDDDKKAKSFLPDIGDF